ncbi:MAG: ABC transporter permease [Candidatus Sumerlaeaceae bacterium]|nr:ABC transporter permease [Candidatus Sumerlaeaceae bacterium]
MQRAPIEQEVVIHSRLLALFVRRELKARYAGSLLGIFWSVIHPIIMLSLYIIVFSALVPRSGRLPFRSATAEYAVFLCPALIAWNWFHEALMGACHSVVAHAALIRKTVFPVAILPCVSIAASALGFVVGMMAFLVFLILVGYGNWLVLLWLPILAVLQALLMLGPAFLFATLHVFLRDTAQVVLAALQILFWATPIVYPSEVLTKVSPVFEWWFRINPVARLVDAYRQVIIIRTAPDPEALIYLVIVVILLYHAGRSAFERARTRFVDEV